ncbi:MAG: hypothetical protein PVG24_05190 [Gammaproteobacteria bacterium]|jgi:hypothetical protein
MTRLEKPPIADVDEDPNVELRPFSSPPCYAHEVDPAYFGLSDPHAPSRGASLRRALRDAQTAIGAASRILSRL